MPEDILVIDDDLRFYFGFYPRFCKEFEKFWFLFWGWILYVLWGFDMMIFDYWFEMIDDDLILCDDLFWLFWDAIYAC